MKNTNVGSFPVGTQVTLQSKATGTDGATWYKVVNSSNAGGWVKGTYLTTDHPSEADWVARYTTFVFVVSNTWREGCANLQTDLNTYFRNRFANTEITYPWYRMVSLATTPLMQLVNFSGWKDLRKTEKLAMPLRKPCID